MEYPSKVLSSGEDLKWYILVVWLSKVQNVDGQELLSFGENNPVTLRTFAVLSTAAK